MNTTEKIENIRRYFEDNLPPLLTSAGLKQFVRYNDEPPLSLDDFEFSVYMADGSWDSFESEGFIIQSQMPGVMRPDHYHNLIWDLLINYNESNLGFDSKSCSYSGWYPGENPSGGSSSFLLYELQIVNNLDDCEV